MGFKSEKGFCFLLAVVMMFSAAHALAATFTKDDPQDPDIEEDWLGMAVSVKVGSEDALHSYDGVIDIDDYVKDLGYANGSSGADVRTGTGIGVIKSRSEVLEHGLFGDGIGTSTQTVKPFVVDGTGVVQASVEISFDGILVVHEQSASEDDWSSARVEYMAEIQEFSPAEGARTIVGNNAFDGVAWVKQYGAGASPVIERPETYVWMEEEGASPNSWHEDPNLLILKVVAADAGEGEINVDDIPAAGTKAVAAAQLGEGDGRFIYYLEYNRTFEFDAEGGKTYYVHMDLQTSAQAAIVGEETDTYVLSDFSHTINFELDSGDAEVINRIALQDQTMVVDIGNPTISDELVLKGSVNTVDVDDEQTATFEGVISGEADLKKAGEGTMVLGAANTYTGTLEIEEGTVLANAVNALSADGAVQVNSGAVLDLDGNNQVVGTLSGSGTVDVGGGALVVSSLKPGQSIGTLTIDAGNFTLADNGDIEVEFDNAGNADLVDVTAGGAVIGSDTTMTPVPVGHISAGRTVTFIQTTAGITGTFDSINDDYALLNFSSAVDGNDYELTIDKLTYDTAAASGNQLSLSQVLNALNTSEDADVQAFLYQIDLLSASGIGAGYNALVPSLSLNMDLIARSNSALFFDQISRYAVSDYKADDQDVYAYIMGALGSLSNTGGNLGAAWETYGIGAGRNIFTSGEAAIGIAGGGVWSDADGNDSIGSGTMKGVQTALYGRTGGDLGWGNLLLGYGRNWNKTARPIGFLGAAADSTWESDVYSASLAAGWDMASDGPVKFQPTAALNYTRVNAESYFETGAGTANLSVDSGVYESLRHEAGVRAVCRAWANNEKGIQSDFKLLWVHEYADRDSTRTVSLAGERFQVSSARPSRDSLAAGVGLAFAMPGGLIGRLAYDSELSRDMTVQSLSLDIKIKF